MMKIPQLKRMTLLLIVRGWSSLASLVSTWLIAQRLEIGLVGEIFLYLSLCLPAATLARLGSDVVSSRSVGLVNSLDYDFINDLKVFTFVSTFIGAIVFGVTIILITSAMYDTNLRNEVPGLNVIVFCIVFFNAFERSITSLLLMCGNYVYSQILQFGVAPILILIFLYILLPDFGALGALLSYAAGSMVFLVGLFFVDIDFKFASCARLFGSVQYIKSCFRVWSTTLVGILLASSTLPLLAFSQNSAEIGKFVMVLKVVIVTSFVGHIIKNSNALIMSRLLDSGDFSRVVSLVKRNVMIIFTICGLYLLFVNIFSIKIFGLFGEEYVVSQSVLVLVSAAYLLHCIGIAISSVLILDGRDGAMFASTSFSAVIVVLTLLLGTPIYGVIAAGWALVLGFGLDVLIQFIIFRKIISKKF